ncbi:L,D-transpeptidase family protein [Desulfomicrobium baculatum]|uniref:ErfK/YbiS/YcfS/YnhG family protein n=1 Tax=Desulfomicrobium baculatum (strain DSM 4028 / VKM B-1378 / X) TaxID=525897 RepID=C7LSC1_DESBD|nr:L,D-transpeptidase family protein [Desulfomicrobium baculatum]ACU90669.1 ErfK/YbiS/YcfS/YnhG family protein [Desulfomicrobium baculatum DSM 4028]
MHMERFDLSCRNRACPACLQAHALPCPGVVSIVLLGLFFLTGSWATAFADDSLFWFRDGRPGREAFEAVAILADADTEGLSPRKYGAVTLGQALEASQGPEALPLGVIMRLEQDLTEAMVRYFRDLHFGQIDPRQIQENFTPPAPDRFDPLAHLQRAVREKRLREAVREAAPQVPLYGRLREALAQYRQLSEDPVFSQLWQSSLPPLPNGKLEIGESYAGMPLVVLRLIALGDLPRETVMTERYEGHIVKGIMDFQVRHGLEPDGVIGRKTYAQLGVTPSARVRQIELSMERLRWTPLLHAPRMIAVNIPEHVLEAYEVQNGTVQVQTTMRVIIGSALNMRTPLFDGRMRSIEFSPYWNVPLSIARSEVVPKILRDPSYFVRQGFEFVAADGQIITTLSMDDLEAVRSGQMRIRQRPGPRNALGDIKFIFPNKDSIFLHHTPTTHLFEKQRRDLSHGCIRVEDPVGLAKFVLQHDQVWGEERIREAMSAGVSSTLRLREPPQVVLAYNTVQVKNGGRVHFFQDIYGQDKLLDQALRRSVQTSQ